MFLETLSDPIRAVKTMLIVKLLSSHAQDEVYLVSKNDWISVNIWQYNSKSRFTILLKSVEPGSCILMESMSHKPHMWIDLSGVQVCRRKEHVCWGKSRPRSCMACIPVCRGNIHGKLVIHHVADFSPLAVPQIAETIVSCVQDPQAKRLQENFIQALKDAETTMHQRNKAVGPASRARHSPAGVPYKLMYPSGGQVNASNQGVTGRGIP